MISFILFNFWGYGLIYASTRTIQSHAYVLNNFHSFFVFLINWSQGEAMIKREYIGLAIVALGCLVMMMDQSAKRQGEEIPINVIFKADLLNLVSSLAGAFYLIISSDLKNELPICQQIVFMNFNLFFMNAILSKFFTAPDTVIFSTNPNNGCLGFFSSKIAFIAFVPYALCACIFGQAG